MPILGREAILGKLELKKERVAVPEWGGDVFVSELSGKDRDKWETDQYIVKHEGGKVKVEQNSTNMRARLVVLCCVDEDGKRIFTDDDAETLGSASAAALDRVYSKAQKLNKLTGEDVEVLVGE